MPSKLFSYYSRPRLGAAAVDIASSASNEIYVRTRLAKPVSHLSRQFSRATPQLWLQGQCRDALMIREFEQMMRKGTADHSGAHLESGSLRAGADGPLVSSGREQKDSVVLTNSPKTTEALLGGEEESAVRNPRRQQQQQRRPSVINSEWFQFNLLVALQVIPTFAKVDLSLPQGILREEAGLVPPEYCQPNWQGVNAIIYGEERRRMTQKEIENEVQEELVPLIAAEGGGAVLMLHPRTRDVFVHRSAFSDEEGMVEWYLELTDRIGMFFGNFLNYDALTGKVMPPRMQAKDAQDLFSVSAYIDGVRDSIHFPYQKTGYHKLWVPQSGMDPWELEFRELKGTADKGKPKTTIRDPITGEVYYHIVHIHRPHRVLANLMAKERLHPLLSLATLGKMSDRDRGFIKPEIRQDVQILKGRILCPHSLTDRLNEVVAERGYRSMFWVPAGIIDEAVKPLIRGEPALATFISNQGSLREEFFYNEDQFPPSGESFEWSWSRLYGKNKEAIEFESRYRLEQEVTANF